ncbi:MAG: sucrase ferredoxin [Candidatus Limnocylindria bacterium]
MTLAASRCRAVSAALDEPMLGTAAHQPGWVLLEQPGPWGRDALLESRLDPDLGRALKVAAKRLGLRAGLIRRHGRYPEADARRTVFFSWTDASGGFVERLELDDPAQLLEADLEGLAAGRAPGFGVLHAAPIYLVCTNGRRDACCADVGRPVAAVLSAALGDAVWESSHLGGHRFAGNLACLPGGVLYGRVTPDTAPRIAAAHADGRLDLEHLRGRVCFPPSVQAAEGFLRQATGEDRLDAVALVDVEPMGAEHVVRLLLDGSEHRVVVRGEAQEPARAVSCGAEELEQPVAWRLVGLGGEEFRREP